MALRTSFRLSSTAWLPPTLKCMRPFSPNFCSAALASMAASSIFSRCRYWLATCGSRSSWRCAASFSRSVAVAEVDGRIPHLQVEVGASLHVVEERALAAVEDLGRIGVVHGVAVRAVDLLERQQLRFRQPLPGIDARIDDTGSRAKRPLQGLLHVGLLFSPQSSALCAGSPTSVAVRCSSQPASMSVASSKSSNAKWGRSASMQWLSREPLASTRSASAGDTEVGAAVADHDRQLARGALGEAALAVARQRPAVAARMREGETPAVVAAPLQMIGGDRAAFAVRGAAARPRPCDRARPTLQPCCGQAGAHNAANVGNPGSISMPATKSSISAWLARTRSIWRTMHSREPMRPAFQSSSMSRHAGSAKRSSSRSVVSTDAMVPSKSTNRRHFIRARDTSMEPVDRFAPSWPKDWAADGLFSRQRKSCQSVSFTFTLTLLPMSCQWLQET